MFDEKKYQESFSVIHASSNLLSSIQNATDKKRERFAPKAIRIAIVCLALVLMPTVTIFAYNCFKSVFLCFDGDAELIEQDIRVIEETAADVQYEVYVDSLLADSYSTIPGLSIEALADESACTWFSQKFDVRDRLSFDYEGTAASFMSMSYKASDRTDRKSIGLYLKYTDPKVIVRKRPGRA